MIGGVIAYHPYLRDLLEEKFQQKVRIIEKPIYVVSYGAALTAKKHSQMNANKIADANVEVKSTAG
jgi:activator of 2-hydroxyglutaryl-CoA dehydratase